LTPNYTRCKIDIFRFLKLQLGHPLNHQLIIITLPSKLKFHFTCYIHVLQTSHRAAALLLQPFQNQLGPSHLQLQATTLSLTLNATYLKQNIHQSLNQDAMRHREQPARFKATLQPQQTPGHLQIPLRPVLAQLDQNRLDYLIVDDNRRRGQEPGAEKHRLFLDILADKSFNAGYGREAHVEQSQPAHVAATHQVLDWCQHHVRLGTEHVLKDRVAE